MIRDVTGLCDANFILKRFINSNLPHLDEFLHDVSFVDTWSRGIIRNFGLFILFCHIYIFSSLYGIIRTIMSNLEFDAVDWSLFSKLNTYIVPLVL
jgi:hypothetical protein